MIPYVEILDPKTLKILTQIEPQECWFELSYYEVGEFEVYATATKRNLEALKKGRFIKIPNKNYIWFITAVKYTFNAEGGRMISATGYEAKWLLSKRIILTPKELQGTITSAVYGLVNHALGTGANAARKINGFEVNTNNLGIVISGTQAPRGNLLEFVNTLLKSNNCGSHVAYINGKLKYTIFYGSNKTSSVRFSQSLDNLLSSEYLEDESDHATHALVVSTIEDIDYTLEHDMGATGIDRSEILINSNINTKYEDANGVEKETTPTSVLYRSWQDQEAINELANHKTAVEIKGEIDTINSLYEFNKDYFIGDLVRIQEEYFNYYYDIRILKYTFRQDANGYGESADYGN